MVADKEEKKLSATQVAQKVLATGKIHGCQTSWPQTLKG